MNLAKLFDWIVFICCGPAAYAAQKAWRIEQQNERIEWETRKLLEIEAYKELRRQENASEKEEKFEDI